MRHVIAVFGDEQFRGPACFLRQAARIFRRTRPVQSVAARRPPTNGITIGAPAAIASAVEDALRPFDVTVTDLPLTPERILALIARKK